MKTPILATSLLALALAATLGGCGRTPVQKPSEGAKLIVNVKDAEGPVAGAAVQVLQADGSPAATSAQSDEAGAATFEDLPAGEGYTVMAEHDGATGKQTNVTLLADEATTVAVLLKTSSGPGGMIAGTVKVAGTERVLPGAKVQIVGSGLSATADETGHYKLDNVPAGQVQVKATFSGYYDGVRDLLVKAGTSNTLVFELAPMSAGNRAQHTLITTAAQVVEVDQYHNPVAATKTSQAWSAVVNRQTGNLLIADAGKGSVVEATDKGTQLKALNGTSWYKLGIGGLSKPQGASYTSNATVLVADTGNDRVVEIDMADKKVWEFKTRLKAPRWAERLKNGNVLIADTGNNRVVEIDSNGAPVWGVGDGSTNVVNHPTYAQRLPNGNTLVTDAGNSRVMEINPKGQLVWMVGQGRPVEGDAAGKNLNNPNSAVRLPSGNTLIADTGNNRVIEVDAKNSIVWSNAAPAPLFADRL